MSNKNVRVKVRALVDAEEIRDKSDPGSRPGKAGPVRRMKIDVPVVEIPYDEFLQRIEDAQNVLLYGNVVAEALPPEGIADEPEDMLFNGCTLKGTVLSREVATTVTFQYGTTLALGSEAAAAESPVNSADPEEVSYALGGLSELTKYYFRLKCVSATKTTYSLIKSFTTPADPGA